ncbi:MAG TPA: hypothetical protein VK991_15670 [Halomonas sp.]|nr:hypothetical protein [Halomonas sp.]
MTDAGRRRGASPRPRKRRPPPTLFDRWLDRSVILSVSAALVVGVTALIVHLMY